MNRLLLTLLVALALVGPLAGGGASAKDGGRGGDDRGRRIYGIERPRPGYGDEGGAFERRRGAREYAPPPIRSFGYEPAPTQGVRRGGYMPPDYRGEALGDYGRYRLRPPPRGYAWYRVGGGYALVSIYSGQIFDMIPD